MRHTSTNTNSSFTAGVVLNSYLSLAQTSQLVAPKTTYTITIVKERPLVGETTVAYLIFVDDF